MKLIYLKNAAVIITLLLSLTGFSGAQTANRVNKSSADATKSGETTLLVEERNVRAGMDFLAGDALQGRGSGTQFERIAAQYFASQMQQFGVEPAGDADVSGKTFIQTVNITRNSFAGAPKLTYMAAGTPIVLEHGKEMIIFRMTAANISGSLEKMNLSEKPKAGAVVFIRPRESDNTPNLLQNLQTISANGAAAVLVEETPQFRAQWENLASRRLSFTNISNVTSAPSTIIFVSKNAADALAQNADGTAIEIKGELAPPEMRQTWNALGKITGSDAKAASEVVLLSAHMDHLGVRENAPGDDKLFNGADDNASGCVAVLELARALASGQRPKRTVYFAFFGSEEAGGYGSNYFVSTLSFPKENLVANLNFEMIGRPDAKIKAEELWVTGYDRSNLGAELAKQGARLVADPHPDQNFFQRSDNYTLARQGIIAHTVSSFGLHTDYHRASDELKTIDFNHMTQAISSMIKPVQWLINSNFKPAWYEGKKP